MGYKLCSVAALSVIFMMVSFQAPAAGPSDISAEKKVQTEAAPAETTRLNKQNNSETPEKQNVPLAERKTALQAIDGAPLEDSDFIFSGITLGDNVSMVKDLIGDSQNMIKGNLRTEYDWDGMTVVVNDSFPYNYMMRTDLDLPRVLEGEGIASFYISKPSAMTRRKITVGDSRENVLRSYGRPEQVLWDGQDQSFYFSYTKGNKMLLFKVKDDMVASVQVSYGEKQYILSDAQKARDAFLERKYPGILLERDFSMAGYHIGTSFKEHSWDIWEKKMTNPHEEIWYFKGYAVRMALPDKKVNMIFLRDKQMVTSRGLAMGDDISTMEVLYGQPQKKEQDLTSGEAQTVYFYLSGDQKQVMAIYVNQKTNKVSGILTAESVMAQSETNNTFAAEAKK